MQQMQEKRTVRSCLPVQTCQNSSVNRTIPQLEMAVMMIHKPPTCSTR